MSTDKKNATPPKLAACFLGAICPDDLCEEIEGDLMQRFGRDIQKYGLARARIKYCWNVVRFFRPGIVLRSRKNLALTSSFMIGNYFKVAARVMVRNKAYSAINIMGLTLGIASALLLFLWIEKEFSYDQFHSDKDRIFVAWNRQLQNGEVSCWSITPRVLAPTINEEYSGVESAVSYAAYHSEELITVGDKRILKNTGVFTDPEFLTMFSLPMIKGDPATALSNPNSIVLTESLSRQLFGDKESLGETLTVGESGYTFPFTVTGILKDLPDNTGFDFEYLISLQFFEDFDGKDTYWGNNSVSTFVKLRPGTDVNEFNEVIKNVVKKHFEEEKSIEIFLYPLTRMRLYSGFENGIQTGGRIEIIRMIGMLGICLVVISCINFINLSTARAQKRSKEVGIRKVTGAFRVSLITQFLCESVLIAFGAGMLSLLIVYLALPWFSTLVNQPLTLAYQSITFWAAILLFIVFIGMLAGAYPAFYLSAFHPIRVLKGALINTAGRNTLREVLVTFQFGFAVTLIVSVIVVRMQIEHTQNRSVGYNKDNLVYQPMTGDLSKNYQVYRRDLLASGAATDVTKTSWSIADRWSNTTGIEWRGKDPQDKTTIERINSDQGIVSTLGLTILQGRDLDLDHFSSDSTGVLLNEAAVSLMGFDQPVGEVIRDNGIDWQVIGVVKDFVLTSPYQKISPIVLLGAKRDMFMGIHIRLNPNQPVGESIATVKSLSTKYNPEYPFDFRFIDEEYQRKFASLETTLTISTLFGFITIFIACLGLLGLSTYMIVTRTKEIGIRKVLGSSIPNIVRMLSLESLRPILLAILIFTPVAWWSMRWWLNSFDYRISLSAWVFLVAGLSILTISFLTIGIQTFLAAKENPAKSLRTE